MITSSTRFRTLTAVAIAVAVAPAMSAPGGEALPEFVEDQVIARLTPGTPIEPIMDGLGWTALESIPELNAWLIEIPSLIPEDIAVELLELQEGVEYAEVNFVHFAPGGNTQSFFVSALEPDFGTQPAWDVVGLGRAQQLATGRGVTVAILDTGVDHSHASLTGHVRPGGPDLIDGDFDPAESQSGADLDGDGFEDEMFGHGTFMAGLVTSIAPESTVIMVRVLDPEGRGDAFHVSAGLVFAANAGVDIANLSLGTAAASMLIDDAVDFAAASRVIVVTAAGNDDQSDPAQHPAAHALSVAVGATDASDVKADFSSFGAHLTICAPGVDIISTIPGDGFGRADGTSMSCAIVSGILALALSDDAPILGRDGVIERMRRSAAPLDGRNPGYEGLLGAGRVSAWRLLDPTGTRVRRPGIGDQR